MAKQTFTTGQVLTAAQMTSLQQTAMLGGAASAKTASYTLVAADAGTAITMSNASATTITVNTALFAAGDTVQITNLGAGVCTITAGTATVNTSASLALAQYESGTLDFTSTSAAIFIKGAGAAAASGGMTLISTTTLTGASVTLSSIPQTYNHLQLIVQNWIPVNDNANLRFRFNADATASRHVGNSMIADVASSFGSTSAQFSAQQDNGTSQSLIVGNVLNYTNTTTWKFYNVHAIGNNSTTTTEANYVTILQGAYNQTTAISSIELFANTGNLTSGTVLLYGVK